MTDTEVKYLIRRSNAILSTCIDAIFHWPPCAETAELFDRITAMLEIVKRDLNDIEHATKT